MHEVVLTWSDLSGIDPGVLGGLIVEYAEAARNARDLEPRERDPEIYFAVRDGQLAAARGRVPARRIARLPAWVVSAVRDRLRYHETYWLGRDFVEIRILELAGLVELDVDDDYVLAMLTGLVSAWSWHDDLWGDPVAWFEQDPDLIERAYWRGYELEGDGLVSIRVNEDHWRGTDWRRATLTMIERGMITRAAVIGACFGALDRDFAPAASTWFSKTLLSLDLTLDELEELQPRLRRHLGHRTPATVRATLGWLKEFDRTGRLDDEATAPALAAAVAAPTKVTASAALRLLESIRRRSPHADVVTAARVGLGHAHRDIQRAAARLLLAAGARDVVVAEAGLLEPSVRTELAIAIEPTSHVDPTKSDVDSPGPPPPARPRSTPDKDLAERVAQLLEDGNDAYELELALAGLARPGVAEVLAPLVKRAHTVIKATPGNYESEDRLQNQLAHLVLIATGHPDGPPVRPESPVSNFLQLRLGEIETILAGRVPPRPLLATPTDPAGWVDPEEFVDRFRQRPGDVLRRDLLNAVLRLAPTDRPRRPARLAEGPARRCHRHRPGHPLRLGQPPGARDRPG